MKLLLKIQKNSSLIKKQNNFVNFRYFKEAYVNYKN